MKIFSSVCIYVVVIEFRCGIFVYVFVVVSIKLFWKNRDFFELYD